MTLLPVVQRPEQRHYLQPRPLGSVCLGKSLFSAVLSPNRLQQESTYSILPLSLPLNNHLLNQSSKAASACQRMSISHPLPPLPPPRLLKPNTEAHRGSSLQAQDHSLPDEALNALSIFRVPVTRQMVLAKLPGIRSKHVTS